MRVSGLLNLVLGLALAIMIGWVLYVGRPILLPVVVSLIAVYVLVAATEALAGFGGLSRVPRIVLRALVLAVFTLALLGMAVVVVVTARALIASAPTYESQIELMLLDVADRLGIESIGNWQEIRRAILEALDFQLILTWLLGSVTSLGAMLVVIIVYATFLMGERDLVFARLKAAFPDGGRAEQTLLVVRDINTRVGEYLAVKTLINILLGSLSFAILWAMDVDFALFWALVIGLLNYIPYVGSLLGVAFPVVFSIAQFGSLQATFVLAVLLTAAQTLIGNVVEPRLIGRQLNLSPFVVLLSLSVWSTLWGIPGAILAVPMTSVLVIVLTSFESTRFIAILMSQRAPSPEARK